MHGPIPEVDRENKNSIKDIDVNGSLICQLQNVFWCFITNNRDQK